MELQAVKWTFGFNDKQAKEYIKNASKSLIDEIVRGYKMQCHFAFYED